MQVKENTETVFLPTAGSAQIGYFCKSPESACPAALAGARAAESVLFGIRPDDPFTFATTAALLAVIGGAAAFLPARRASRLDPSQVLRNE